MLRTPQDDLLATDFGVEALYEAARDRAVSTSAWPSPAAADPLVDWLLAHASDPAIATVLELARIRVGYRGPAVTHVAFTGKAVPLVEPERVARELRTGIARALTELGFPGDVTLGLDETEAGVQFTFLLPSRWMHVSTGGGRQALGFRSSVVTATYSPGYLDIAAFPGSLATPLAHVALLATELGRAGFGDPRFFVPASLVALRPLQRGARAFKVPAEHADEIEQMRMIELEWDSGGPVTLTLAGADCPKEMKKLGLHIEGGEILATTIRFNFKTAPHHADVALRPPNEVTCSEPDRAAIVFACLERKKVLARGKPPSDLWSLDPWVPSDNAARAFFGKAFGELVEEKVLVPSRSRAVVHPDYPASGRRLIAFPIPSEPGRWYGATDGLRIPARTLEEKDLVSWRLKLVALGRRIARAIRLEGTVRLLERRGVIDLGAITLGNVWVRLFLLTRMPLDPKALAERLRLLALPGHVLLLVPPGRSAGTDLAEATLARVEGPYDSLLVDAARALGILDKIDPIHVAPPGTRLVVHLASKRVWFDGLLLSSLREQGYRLVEILAQLGGEAISRKELAEKISSTNVEGATGQAKHALKRAIEEAFAREGRKVPKDAARIVERVRRGEVRMGVTVFVA